MLIIPDYDSQALAAPQSFRDGIQAAINILDATFTTNITVRIAVGYGEAGAFGPLPDQNHALGGFLISTNISYSQLRDDLIRVSNVDATSASLPDAQSVNGHSSFVISSAQERLFGLLPAVNGTSSDDGQVGFGTSETGSHLISIALHEFTHALGRTPVSSLDIFRFTSPGNRLFTGGTTAVPAYFSMDNGATDLADFGQNSDPSDFLNPPASNLTPNDPFNESAGDLANLTSVDIEEMEALGFGGHAPLTPPRNDFNDNGTSDLMLQNTNGTPQIWLMNGTNVASMATLPGPPSSWHIVASGDFNGDLKADILWQNVSDGEVLVWEMNGTSIVNTVALPTVPTSWHIITTADFAGNGQTDILWQNDNGAPLIWMMNGTSIASAPPLPAPPPSWHVIATGDFNGDGKADILWQNVGDGEVLIWEMNGASIVNTVALPTVPTSWHIIATGDFAGNGQTDILWQNDNGAPLIWMMNGTTITSAPPLPVPPSSWHVIGTGDYNGDGKADIIWQNSDGTPLIWLMNGTSIISSSALPNPGATWHVKDDGPIPAGQMAGAAGVGLGGLGTIATSPPTALVSNVAGPLPTVTNDGAGAPLGAIGRTTEQHFVLGT